MKRKTRFLIRLAFTLIELLVVMSLIGILAPLLLPVLRKAKEIANHIGCIFNIKEIGVAMVSYNLDNHEGHEGEYEVPFVGELRWLGPYILSGESMPSKLGSGL